MSVQRAGVGAGAGRGTYLTVDWGRGVQTDEIENHSHEGGQACKGVYLPRAQVRLTFRKWAAKSRWSPDNTDPYCPPIGSTAADDTPLVVKGREELPTRVT